MKSLRDGRAKHDSFQKQATLKHPMHSNKISAYILYMFLNYTLEREREREKHLRI